MDIKKLNEELCKFIEDESESTDVEEIITKIKNCEYDGEENIADIILNNIDRFNYHELTQIIDKGRQMTGYKELFPSAWNYNRKDEVYPIKLAKALSKSIEKENIRDIYNVFYKQRNHNSFKEAIEVWMDSILDNIGAYEREYLYDAMDYPTDVKQIYDTIEKEYPDFINSLYDAQDIRMTQKIKKAE